MRRTVFRHAAFGTPARSSLTFRGTASLPVFPCDLGNPTGTGTFSGTVSGILTGYRYGVPWTAVLADAPVAAGFTYADTVSSGGIASGTLSCLTGDDHLLGTYGPASPLRRRVTGASVAASFTSARVGAAARLGISGVTVRLRIGGTGWVTVVAAGAGEGLASFTPGLGSGITATVEGVAVLAQAA